MIPSPIQCLQVIVSAKAMGNKAAGEHLRRMTFHDINQLSVTA
jgi:hypothetical protein